jgi:hypothetical protein
VPIAASGSARPANGAQELHQDAEATNGIAEDVLHVAQPDDRQRGIDFTHGARDRRLQRGSRHRGARHEVHAGIAETATEPATLDRREDARDLIEQHVELRAGRVVDPGLLDVPCHVHHRDPRRLVTEARAHPSADFDRPFQKVRTNASFTIATGSPVSSLPSKARPRTIWILIALK